MKHPELSPQMSVVCDRVLVSQKKGNKMDKMCVYCESVFTSDTVVCHNCNEYDGMMPLENAIDYLNLDPNDFF
jgi:hypothetical protein